ncbi:MAG: DNA mismatch repair endonuclease MutL [Candidatus Dojkabacteria bacterium]|nr:DNA mismatch repair endonuclease MutL [Candidatus Dojkabacteria bacterium]MDQ7020429.1 DNA mismatch repair endonuclease MutL [Candidatus Dojkabacteria bacterium]
MSKINKLEKEIINKIAAGEVVERPASVIKELIENSIDAKASKIIINIENNGEDLIEIVDNGKGMNREDAIKSVELHATSKITNEKDLSYISSHGFRGEALASISSVSEEFTIDTKTAGYEAVTVYLRNEELRADISNKTIEGTTISIRNLFGNVPARKKFLKASKTEMKQIINSFLQTSLPYIKVHFELFHDGNLIHRLTKTESIENRLFDAFGKNFLNTLFITNESTDSDLKTRCLISKPESAPKKATIQYIYLNNRFIGSKTINAAVSQAFTGFIHRDLRPNFIIFIKIDPSKIDINVHPRKLEVKFEDESLVFKRIYSHVRSILEKETKRIIKDKIEDSNELNLSKYKNISEPRKDFSVKESSRSYSPTSQSNNYINESKDKIVKQSMSFSKLLLDESISNTEASLDQKISNYNPKQIFNTYILIEKDNDAVFIDQHAASEKIYFEKLIAQYKTKNIKSKSLLVPEIVEFNNTNSKNIILESREELAKLGVVIENLDSKSIQVTEVPEIFKKMDLSDTFKEILEEDQDIVATFESGNLDISKSIYLKLATISCHGSIRAGQILNTEEMNSLINELLTLDNPYNCPHGRPTIWSISKTQLESNFKRDM